MKIDQSIKTGLTGETRSDARPAKPAAAPATTNAGVDVQLSPLAAQLQILTQEVASSPDVFDANQVAQIKQAISEGRFEVNPEVIADRLIATAQELLQAAHG